MADIGLSTLSTRNRWRQLPPDNSKFASRLCCCGMGRPNSGPLFPTLPTLLSTGQNRQEKAPATSRAGAKVSHLTDPGDAAGPSPRRAKLATSARLPHLTAGRGRCQYRASRHAKIWACGL